MSVKNFNFKEAGIPDGCINVIHGTHNTVNFICDHSDIQAISFVGSDKAVIFFFVFNLTIKLINKKKTFKGKTYL